MYDKSYDHYKILRHNSRTRYITIDFDFAS